MSSLSAIIKAVDTSMALSRYTSESTSLIGYLIADLGGMLALWSTWLMYRSGGTPIPPMSAPQIVTQDHTLPCAIQWFFRYR